MREIIAKYTKGEATLEETNAALREAGAGYSLQPGKNEITEQELWDTTVGHFPQQANGYGLLYTGTGTPDKVEVRDGRLKYPINEVTGEQSVSMTAYVVIAGKTYWVYGDELREEEPVLPQAERLPDTPDKSRRKEFAGTVQIQRTKAGRFEVEYDENGYAVRASRI